MFYLTWLSVGLLAVWPLLYVAQRYRHRTMLKYLGQCLVIAAVIYLGFALVWGDARWFAIEILGVGLYGAFAWLALRYHGFWLALGWLLHPAWDIVLHLAGPGAHVVPAWYAVACVSFDVAVAVYVLVRVWRDHRPEPAEPSPA